jgi:predicted DNA-binding transcriptional regulator AlpA
MKPCQIPPKTSMLAPEQWYRARQVIAILNVSRAHFYYMLKHGLFPAPIKASARARCWSASQLCAWQQSRVDASTDNEV